MGVLIYLKNQSGLKLRTFLRKMTGIILSVQKVVPGTIIQRLFSEVSQQMVRMFLMRKTRYLLNAIWINNEKTRLLPPAMPTLQKHWMVNGLLFSWLVVLTEMTYTIREEKLSSYQQNGKMDGRIYQRETRKYLTHCRCLYLH